MGGGLGVGLGERRVLLKRRGEDSEGTRVGSLFLHDGSSSGVRRDHIKYGSLSTSNPFPLI